MLITDSINNKQIVHEKRWDVSFNIEINKLNSKNVDFKTVDEMSEHITNGATPLGANYPEEGINFFKANDVKKYTLDYVGHMYIRPEESEAIARSILQPNDILFTIKGKVGDVAVLPNGQPESNINQDNALIRLKPEYDPFYFTAVFNSKFGLNQIKAFATETVNPFLGIGNLKKLKVPFIEQSVMEDISNKVQQSIEYELKSLNLIKDAQEMLYGELNIDSKSSKEIGFSTNLSDFKDADLWIPKYSYPLYVDTINQIKENFEIVSLNKISDIIAGDEMGRNNYIKYLDRTETDVPFIRTSDILNYGVDLYPDFHVPIELYEETNQDLVSGDILYTKDGKVGMSGMLTPEDKVVIGSGVSRIRINNLAKNYNINAEYLFLILSLKETGVYPAIRRTVVASTIPHLRINRLGEFEIPILDNKISKKLSNIVSEAFNLKDKNKKLIKEISLEIDNELN